MRSSAVHPAPVAARRPSTRLVHGDSFEDPYEWLRDKDAPEVLAHLRAENDYTTIRTAHLAPLHQGILADILARTQETDLTVAEYATHEDGSAFWYYSRTTEGLSYPAYYRAPAPDRDARPDPNGTIEGEQLLLDCSVEATGHDFFSVGTFDISPSGALLAYSVDLAGDERYTLHVRDLRTGQNLPDRVDDVFAGSAWLGDERLYYLRMDDAWRPCEVHRHVMGTPVEHDRLIYADPDERFWVGCLTSRDQQRLVIASASTLTSEYLLVTRADPDAAPRPVCPRRDGVEYHVEVAADALFVLHNVDAPDFALAWAPLDASSAADWRPLIDQRPGARLTGVSAYRDHLVVDLRRDGLSAVDLYDRRGTVLGSARPLNFPEPIHEVRADPDSEYDADRVLLHYESLVTPSTVLSCRLSDGTLTELKRTPVLDHPERGPFHSTDYVQHREWAVAADGTRVPISVVRHRNTPLDGSAPCLLYGYGSYEVSVPVRFSLPRLAVLDRGVVYAIAHVRGGGELGRAWYEQGKLLHKRATFTDFIACAEHLVDAGYTAPDRLAARGASAGGLLMGAITNLAPDLFRAVHADVAFVDPLTTILNPDLPLTVGEWEEWGNPVAGADVYAYMKGYSPYENVAAHRYPAILATTSLNDTRVCFVEPAKWVAALRHTVPPDDDRPILLKTELVAGHGGVSGRYEAWNQESFELAWILDQIGVAAGQTTVADSSTRVGSGSAQGEG